jgi:pimeloyl-ACP methyl ester carboxylesterase
MPTLEVRGVELAWSERGSGSAVLFVHETAATEAEWEPVADAVSSRARAILYDRRGWGESGVPEEYRRTTIEEQSEDAAALLESLDARPAVVCGAGVGAVVALDLMLRRPDFVAGAVLVEPPVLQLLPVATEAMSDDRRRLETAAAQGENVVGVYLSGALPALGPGIARLPEALVEAAREHPRSVLAELGMAASWRMQLRRLATAERPSEIVTSGSTPPLIRDAAKALAARLALGDAQELDSGSAPAHLGAPDGVAELALSLSS